MFLCKVRSAVILSLQEYDRVAPTRWPHRIPNLKSKALQERLGDCIFDFSGATPVQRLGVHEAGNILTDLSGKNALISRDFYYFGSRAKPLPDELLPICHQTQGHRSASNDPYVERFVAWIRSVVPAPGQLYGWPDFILEWNAEPSHRSCAVRADDGKQDSPCQVDRARARST